MQAAYPILAAGIPEQIWMSGGDIVRYCCATRQGRTVRRARFAKTGINPGRHGRKVAIPTLSDENSLKIVASVLRYEGA